MPGALVKGQSLASDVRTPLAYRLAYAIGKACLRLMFRFEVIGRGHVPGGAYIAVANHLNWLDAFAILIALPRDPRLHLVGWDTVARAPKLWWLVNASRAGFIAVPRDPDQRSRQRREVQEALGRCLSHGYPVALFPEGSVGQVEGRVSEFKPGFSRLALATAVDVVPIALSGTRNLWLRKKVRIAIGAPIQPQGLERAELVNRVYGAVVEMLPEYAEPRGWRLLERRLTRLIPALTNWSSADL